MDNRISISRESAGGVTINVFVNTPVKKDDERHEKDASSHLKRGIVDVEKSDETKRRQVSGNPLGSDEAGVTSRNSGKEQHDNDEFRSLEASYEYHRDNPDYFQMTTRPKGIVLIINNHFARSKKSKPRLGALEDILGLTKAFTRVGGCNVLIKQDLSAENIIVEVGKLAHSKEPAAFYAIFIMSHGTSEDGRDMVFGADGVRVSTREIVDIFNVPHLSETPTLIFFQACRGKNEGAAPLETVESLQYNADHLDGENAHDLDQEVLNELLEAFPGGKILGDVANDQKDAIAVLDDEIWENNLQSSSNEDQADESGRDLVKSRPNVMVSFSAAENYIALRREKEGSWFIQEICKHLCSPEADGKDFIQIMNNIHLSLYTRRSATFPGYRAAARTAHTFTKKLMLFPGL